MFFEKLSAFDPEVGEACARELSRQRRNIELIASENIVSEAVLLAAGGVLTNKYAEGYPGRRYSAAQRRVRKLCRVLCAAGAGRYGAFDEPCRGRSSFARYEAECFG